MKLLVFQRLYPPHSSSSITFSRAHSYSFTRGCKLFWLWILWMIVGLWVNEDWWERRGGRGLLISFFFKFLNTVSPLFHQLPCSFFLPPSFSSGDIFIGLLFFTLGKIFEYAVAPQICLATQHYVDGMFFGNAFSLLAVMMVYKYWNSITKEDLEFSLGGKAHVWELKQSLLTNQWRRVLIVVQGTPILNSYKNNNDNHFILSLTRETKHSLHLCTKIYNL